MMTKSASILKKKIAAVTEAVDWAVEDFAKDLQYFHDVIGLPNVGKIPKDITAEDVPLAEVEKHFGVKAKNDKNGYKKEGVKGILAEDIRKLVIALDGIEKFQLFSLEIAKGLYYERILKRAVNWAACGVDKHKGQLCWKFSRKAHAQLELPPWKRVQHKYTAPPGLELSVEAEESELYSHLKPGAPSKGSEASDAKGESNLRNDQAASSGEGKKANDVGGESNMSKDKPHVGVSEEFAIVQEIAAAAKSELDKFELPNIESDREESAAAKAELDELELGCHIESDREESAAAKAELDKLELGCHIESDREESVAAKAELDEFELGCHIESDREESAAAEETSMLQDSAAATETPKLDKASPKIESDRLESAVAEETPMVEGFAAAEETAKVDEPGPKIESLGEERPMFDDPTIKELAITPVHERKDVVLESFLDMMKDNLETLCLQVEKSNLAIDECTSRLEANSELLKSAEEEFEADKVMQSTCKLEVLRLRNDLKEKVVESVAISSAIDLLSDHDLQEGSTEAISEGHQDYLRSCSEANALQQAIGAERRKATLLIAGANDKVARITELDDAHKQIEDEMRPLKLSAARFTQSRDALRAELSRVSPLLGKGSVHVRPIDMACPLQSEESWHPITECPICSLGFFCNNWVPTSCGHCYHPNCLFSLLRNDGNRAPKCEACSEIFHPAWLECWGLLQVRHPEAVKLADDWGLAEQHCSFTNNLLDWYSKNACNIEPRRKAQAAKHKKVTKFYSQESIQKSTQYHETVGKVVLINHKVIRAASKGGRRVGPTQDTGPKHGLLSLGIEGGENSPPQKLKGKLDLSTVKIENVAPELRSRAGSAVTCLSSGSEGATKGDYKKCKVNGETSRDLVDLSIVKTKKGAPELHSRAGSAVTCLSSSSEGDTRGDYKKCKVNGETSRVLVDLSIVKTEKGSPKPGPIVGLNVPCISLESEKSLNETATMGSKKKRKDMGTTAPSPAKAQLRVGTLAQNAQVKPRAAKRGHGQKK